MSGPIYTDAQRNAIEAPELDPKKYPAQILRDAKTCAWIVDRYAAEKLRFMAALLNGPGGA